MPDPRPLPEICPFLVAANDPDSVLNYPSADNLCAKLGQPRGVAPDYQANYCLRTRHWFCPVFTGGIKNPPVPIRFEEAMLSQGVSSASPELALPVTRFESLPIKGAAGRIPRQRTASRAHTRSRRLTLLILFLVVLLTLIVVGGVGFVRSGSFGRSTLNPSPTVLIAATASPTATSTLSPAPTASPTAPPTETPRISITPSETLTETATLTSTATATTKRCTAPTDWGSYTVSAGETYFKIATKFGTTVDALQRVNCLADTSHLLAGQTIRVPPTLTPH